MKPSNRLPSITTAFIVEGHKIHVSLAYDSNSNRLREVIFVGSGKSGHGLTEILKELGIKLSRAIQGRDPETGDNIK